MLIGHECFTRARETAFEGSLLRTCRRSRDKVAASRVAQRLLLSDRCRLSSPAGRFGPCSSLRRLRLFGRKAAAAATAAVSNFPARMFLLRVQPPRQDEALPGLQLLECLLDPAGQLAVCVMSLGIEMRGV